MAVREFEVTFKCRDNVSANVRQYFPCLESINDATPICCKFVLEYAEGVQLPDSLPDTIEEKFNIDFESYLSKGRNLHNAEVSPAADENLRFVT